ncbi:MAG: MCP four helix bundle domain-containing protein [Bacteroidales bacterium]|nr:MCP four helix bundle domain-containing protein [Bacteroidales bacterium]MDD4670193.1 MCP four helix bundle domain-containing protein [Bacteroidales bacterium]
MIFKLNGISQLGIKRKVFLGFIVIGIVLFFSSLISIFEFSRMNNYVSELITDNIKSINTARELLTVTENYNLKLMYGVGGEEGHDDISVIRDDKFVSYFSDLKETFLTPAERSAADSVIYAYTAYMQTVAEAENIWLNGYDVRKEWFFGRLQPTYSKLKSYIQKLTIESQEALVQNSQTLQDSFYRSIMPGVVSVILGLILVLLFNYFLNYYLINPILKITKGIKGYRQFNKSYEVKLENDDELEELNNYVKDIVDLNQSYKKRL